MNLQTRIPDVSRAYKMYASRLEKLGIRKLEDLLYHFPFRYENFSLISKIADLQEGEVATVQGKVEYIKNQYIRRFRTIQKAKISDSTGTIDVIWFNQPFIPKTINTGDSISISGKIGVNGNKPTMQSPDYEVINQFNGESRTIHTGRLVPIYPETRGVSSKWLRRQVDKLLIDYKDKLDEYLPYSILEKLDLTGYNESIEQIHFPKSLEMAKRARERLSFDELFILHLISLLKKEEWEEVGFSKPLYYTKFKKNIESFLNMLPFDLTSAQKKAVREIFADLVSKKPMNRMLQGEVGSGKTVVSAISMYLCFLNGYQSTLMAPTEILAQQHYKTISSLLSHFGVKVELITGSKKPKLKDLPAGRQGQKVDVLIGTHALLYNKFNLKNLRLVVIDEQQRFGVAQRAKLRKKGESVNLLTMTATPIPRTVALTLYGNLDLSYLDEMPVGRKIVKTWLVPLLKRDAAYRWIKDQIKKTKAQVFIVCPFIEESESMASVKSATKEFERLKSKVFPNLNLGIIHGKLKSKEKQAVLDKFREYKIDILVATPVVEVGVDFPNATIILIEGADRFGLAQLHQLRGRVGRSDKQSYCLLFTESQSLNVQKRLKALETMHNGAELAELDLKLRGPGTLYGTMQHGIPNLKIASFSDFELIEKTRTEAKLIFPKLQNYPKLLEKVRGLNLEEVSPD